MSALKQIIERYVAHHAPTEQWQSASCSGTAFSIDKQGDWYHDGQRITRHSLVTLFASTLSYEHGQYTLKTPSEHITIKVEDAPFLITTWFWHTPTDPLLGPILIAEDNLGRQWPICQEFPLFNAEYDGQLVPYLKLNYGLSARVARSVLYQWSECIEWDNQGGYISSAQVKFYLVPTLED